MRAFTPYESGDEWHYLAALYIRKYGYELHQRDLFDLAKLTAPERKRYVKIRTKTMDARKAAI